MRQTKLKEITGKTVKGWYEWLRPPRRGQDRWVYVAKGWRHETGRADERS